MCLCVCLRVGVRVRVRVGMRVRVRVRRRVTIKLHCNTLTYFEEIMNIICKDVFKLAVSSVCCEVLEVQHDCLFDDTVYIRYRVIKLQCDVIPLL